MSDHNYFVYITANPARTTLYVGITNDLRVRLIQHYQNRDNTSTFAGRYHCYELLWWERHQFVKHAIEREKEIKKWRREKKKQLINAMNPRWRSLNSEFNQ